MSRLIQFLLVEDDPDHAELVRRAFESNRISNRLNHVSDGELALQYLRKQHPFEDVETPDVVLLDLNLPKIDGHEVLESIRSDPTLKNLPVVVLTTSKGEQDLSRAYNAHVNSYIVKPLDFEQFKKLIQDIGCYWAVWNQPPV